MNLYLFVKKFNSSFLFSYYEICLICICESLNAFKNSKECDISSETQSNLKTRDMDGDPEDTPGHSFLSVTL